MCRCSAAKGSSHYTECCACNTPVLQRHHPYSVTACCVCADAAARLETLRPQLLYLQSDTGTHHVTVLGLMMPPQQAMHQMPPVVRLHLWCFMRPAVYACGASSCAAAASRVAASRTHVIYSAATRAACRIKLCCCCQYQNPPKVDRSSSVLHACNAWGADAWRSEQQQLPRSYAYRRRCRPPSSAHSSLWNAGGFAPMRTQLARWGTPSGDW